MKHTRSWFTAIWTTMLICMSVPFLVQAEGPGFHVSYLSVNDGLSQNDVTSIIQDQYGFMWFGTRGGLNRFDGYEFKKFKPNRLEGQGIQNPSIERLYYDRQGNIWIGTKFGGYSMYDQGKQLFVFRGNGPQKSSYRVLSFYEDYDKNIWIGSRKKGVQRIAYHTDSVERVWDGINVNTIVQTKDSTIWLGTSEGLKYKKEGPGFSTFTFEGESQEVMEIVIDEEGSCLWMVGWNMHLIRFDYSNYSYEQFKLPESAPKASSYSLMQDKTGIIWVGTWGGGLFRFNKRDRTFSKVNLYSNDFQKTNTDYDIILDIFQDKAGDIWVGTDGGGIVRLSEKNNFNTLSQLLGQEWGQKHVNAVLKDSKDRVWIGTKGQGLFIWDKNNALTKVGPKGAQELNAIKTIYEDGQHNIWVSYDEGLFVVREDKGIYLYPASIAFNSPQLRVMDLLIRNDELWMGTQWNGLFLYKKKNGEFIKERQFIVADENTSPSDNLISSLMFDGQGNLWVGTYNGLYKYHADDSTFIPVQELLGHNGRPLCEIVLSSYLDQKGNIWFGTPCGLNQLRSTQNGGYMLKEYTLIDGLSDDYINSIVEDSKGNIWLGTNAGISKLDAQTGKIKNYNTTSGVGWTNFSRSAVFKAKDGVLYFGSYKDLTFFDPDEITERDTHPQLAITNFKILNKQVPIAAEGVLTKNINERPHLVLGYKEKEFSFEFASLDFKAPEHIQYAYWLEGYNDTLVNIGNRHHVSFSNLGPGDYTLHLRGTNSIGLWSDKEFMLKITVLPAPWLTWYAIVVYIIMAIVVFYLIVRYRVRQVRLESSLKEERFKREQEHGLNELKLRFFTDISHEIRTPLTLIFAPVNELLSKGIGQLSADAITQKLKLVQRNTTRLYQLINQLLEFRKMEAGRLGIEATKCNFKELLDEVLPDFEELAGYNGTTFKKVIKGEDWDCFIDVSKIRIVISNLLSNAFKYAGAPPVVSMDVQESPRGIVVKVQNNGKGITAGDLDNIFDRFYQSNVKNGSGTIGSGIGLSLVKGYVELHKGEISVESVPDQWTTFTLVLKKGMAHLKPQDIKEFTTNNENKHVVLVASADRVKTRSVNTGTKGATVLIVEDNEEVRNYLASLLAENFNVQEAMDGYEGLELALKTIPDLIITDVMMPTMDGYELCERIKKNEKTSDIPVVLLTAKGTPRDQLFGTKKGADAYLTKPFEPELLMEKVKQLLASHKIMEEKYSQKVKLEPSAAEITSEEVGFLNQVISIIEDNISNASFDQEQLANEMSMSISTFYRKVKRICGDTPGEFIKSIRIKRSAQLLEETDLSVSEIAEMTGFQEIRSFRRNFKQQYDLNPMEYRMQKRKGG